jgi:hypothetical protein
LLLWQLGRGYVRVDWWSSRLPKLARATGRCPKRAPYHIFTMCGRYASFLPAEFIARLFATVNPLPNLAPTWNMAPTMDAAVVQLVDGERHLDALKWAWCRTSRRT